MSLIVRPARRVKRKAWVKKDDAGNVMEHGVAPVPSGYAAKNVTAYSSLQVCKEANVVIDHAEALVQMHAKFDERWARFNLSKVYASKVANVQAYRASGGSVVSPLLSGEAALRGITVEAMVVLIEQQAFANTLSEASELIRIAQKLAMP